MAIVIAIATTIAIFVMILIAITMAIAITMTIDDCQGHLVTYEGLQKHSQGNKAWLVGDLTMLRKHVTTVQTSKKNPKTCVVCGGNTYSNCGLCGGYAFFSHEGWFRSRNCFIATKIAILSSPTYILCTVLVMRIVWVRGWCVYLCLWCRQGCHGLLLLFSIKKWGVLAGVTPQFWN